MVFEPYSLLIVIVFGEIKKNPVLKAQVYHPKPGASGVALTGVESYLVLFVVNGSQYLFT